MTAPTDRPLTERDPGFFEALREMEQDTELEDPIPRHINTMLDYDLLVHRYLSVMPRSACRGFTLDPLAGLGRCPYRSQRPGHAGHQLESPAHA